MPVIVEGKYDKITLENVIDTLIIPTNGFAIFKNKEKCDLIRRLAQKTGIIIMTDSDFAGAQIRTHIKNITGGANIINVYIPQLKGKEKRKTTFSKQGFLGVEGMSGEVILEALEKSGVFSRTVEKGRKITKTDMFVLGLSGGSDSGKKRQDFLKFCDLPQDLSPNAMLDIINTIYSYDDFLKVAIEWQKSMDKD